ncbi:MAG: DUF1254 domain-containing protein [Pseudomonadales bacterium]
MKEVSLEDKAVTTWLYFYPLLLTQTRLAAEEELAVNSWVHASDSFSNNHREGLGSNTDTEYSHAWLDLRQGPINMHLPNMEGRYYVIQAIDQWSQTFSAVGSRTTGSKAATVVYLPPGMQKEQYPSGHWPIGASFVKAPSYKVLLLAQLQRGTPDQAKQLSGLHAQFILRRHAETFVSEAPEADKAAVKTPDALLESLAAGLSPVEALSELEPADYFSWASALWGSSAVSLSKSDREFAAEIIQLGLYPGRAIRWQEMTERRQLMLTKAAKKAADILSSDNNSGRSKRHDGWLYQGDEWYMADGYTVKVAQPDNYALRAKMALRSPGHLPLAEVITLSAGDHARGGDKLNGGQGQQYELRFAANNLPPAEGFWSLSVVANGGGVVDNILGRNRIGSDSQLTQNPDGSVTIYLSNKNPHGEHSSDTFNWLPTPAKDFRVDLRVFWPSRDIGGDGGWSMPAIESRAGLD